MGKYNTDKARAQIHMGTYASNPDAYATLATTQLSQLLNDVATVMNPVPGYIMRITSHGSQLIVDVQSPSNFRFSCAFAVVHNGARLEIQQNVQGGGGGLLGVIYDPVFDAWVMPASNASQTDPVLTVMTSIMTHLK